MFPAVYADFKHHGLLSFRLYARHVASARHAASIASFDAIVPHALSVPMSLPTPQSAPTSLAKYSPTNVTYKTRLQKKTGVTP